MDKLKKRTVAYLDILGFQNILNTFTTAIIGNAYENAINVANEIIESEKEYSRNPPSCHISIFSDSIAIFSPDDLNDWHGFLRVVECSKRIMQSLISFGLPIRGGIAYGETYLDKNKSIFLGEGYMKALKLEGKQQWIGITIDESVENNFPCLKQLIVPVFVPEFLLTGDRKTPQIYKYPFIQRYKVPFKDDYSELRYTVNWLDKFTPDNESFEDLINHTINMANHSLSESVNKLRQNTVGYVKYINSIIENAEDATEKHLIQNDQYTYA